MEQPRRHYQPTITKQHIGPGTTHTIYHFENGYGASVIPEYGYDLPRGHDSYEHREVIPDCLELAVLKYIGGPADDMHDDRLWDICYDTHITDDTLHRLTPAEVATLLDQIAGL